MGQDESQERAQQLTADDPKSAEQLRAEIEDVRSDLGDTAAALAAKTDVKTRAREKADELKRAATERKDDLLSKVGRSPSNGGASTSASVGSTVDRAKTTARQNPVLVAAVGALIGGFAIGRLTRRDT
jgi:chromosome segregation ATPase